MEKPVVNITLERFEELNKAEILCKMYKRMYESLKKINDDNRRNTR